MSDKWVLKTKVYDGNEYVLLQDLKLVRNEYELAINKHLPKLDKLKQTIKNQQAIIEKFEKCFRSIQAFHGFHKTLYRDIDGKLYKLDTSPIDETLKQIEEMEK